MATLTRDSNAVTTDFEPCPAGDLQLVVVDVVDHGWKHKFHEGVLKGYYPQVQIVFQAVGEDEDGAPILREDGSRYLVFGRKCWVTVDSRASLYKEVCGIIGEKNFNDMLDTGEFDTEDLIGKNVFATIVHNPYKDTIFANIEGMRPWSKKLGPFVESEGFTRKHERDVYEAPEFSCWAELDDVRAAIEASGEEFRPPKAPVAKKPAPSRAATPPPPPPRSAQSDVITQPSNPNANSRAHAKALAKGEETAPMARPARPPVPAAAHDDDDDTDIGNVFDDEDDTPMTLIDVPKQSGYGQQ